ncbi:plasma membrane fusion protein [Wolffia australiana]
MGGVRVVSSISVPPLPPRRASKGEREALLPVEVGRRSASAWLLSLSVPLIISECCPQASAISFGIPGPKEWLKDQKKNAARFVLAPIDASRRSLQSAYLFLSRDPESPFKDPGQVRNLVSAAARDCVVEDRSSIVAFQASTGVEVCTFRLILKNAASLLDKYDPITLEAETKLDTLIRSFTLLGKMINEADLQIETDREKVKVGLNDTIFALGKFEESIKDCLGA